MTQTVKETRTVNGGGCSEVSGRLLRFKKGSSVVSSVVFLAQELALELAILINVKKLFSQVLMAGKVMELAVATEGKEALAIEAFANALTKVPTIIADNAGYDSADLVSRIRAKHAQG